MFSHTPDYRNLLDAARRVRPRELPLYDHLVNMPVMEKILGKEIGVLMYGDQNGNIREGFHRYYQYFREMGYDCASYEECVGGVLPGGGCLSDESRTPAIKTMADLERYPWDEVPDLFFSRSSPRFDMLEQCIPEGMGLVGGVGNGIFECAEELCGYTGLCFMKYDDPELYAEVFVRVGELLYRIWERFLGRWGRFFTVCRIGDDMGYKSQTLLPDGDIRALILPQYRRIIALVHRAQKPFLLHSCGNIFNVMDDLIAAGINAKHSNEKAIAPLEEWLRRYGDRIAIFGGLDMDTLARYTPAQVKEESLRLVETCSAWPGFAFGTGNSIPEFLPVENVLAMYEAMDEFRNKGAVR